MTLLICLIKLIHFLHVNQAVTLIKLVGEQNFKRLNIKGIFAGSESFPKGQMEYIKNKFNIPIAHWYGHSEYAILAKYCDHCDGFHFYFVALVLTI